MKIYLVRHGRTEWNVANRVLGRTDIPLDEVGLAQARELSEKLRDVHFDLAFCSPLARAVETCSAICAPHGLVFSSREELIEQDFGVFEGEDRADPAYRLEKARFFSRYAGGAESFMDVAARVYPFLDSLAAEHGDESILLVTHNGICRVVNSYFRDMENDEFLDFAQGNCEVGVFER